MTHAVPPSASRRRWRRIVLGLIAIGIVVAYVERHVWLTLAGGWLNVSASLHEPVDYVMVLGGGANSRPFVAVQIMRAGLARQILIPRFDVSEDVRDGISLPEHEVIRQVALRSGISADAIVPLETTVSSTADEAQSLALFLDTHPGADVAIVTSDFHTRRTRLIFSRVCGRHTGNLHIVGAPTDGFDAANWWRFEDGFKLYLNEYLKLARTLVL